MSPAPDEPVPPDGMQLLTGPQRVAALLMLIGEEDAKALWSELDDAEIRKVCLAMGELGPVKGETVAQIVQDFVAGCGAATPVTGSLERAQELLARVFPAERVTAIMADVKGVTSGRQVWRRLADVPPATLAGFLRDEYPQTVAVVLSRLGTEQGGRILALLPDDLAVDVIDRLLRLGEVKPEAIEKIEDMLHREFLANGIPKPKRDTYEVMAERFDSFDRQTEARFLAALERADKDTAQRIREKMLTFEDLLKLDAAGIQTLMRQIDKDVLGRALKGATEDARSFFLANMSSRAGKNLQEDMEALGSIRLKEVEDAQGRIVQIAKALSTRGEIRIAKARIDEDLVA